MRTSVNRNWRKTKWKKNESNWSERKPERVREREKRKKNLTAASNGIWCDSKSSENRRSHSNNNTDMMLSIWRDLSLSLYVYVRKHISGWCLLLCAHRMKKNDDWRLFWPTPSAQHKPLDGIQSLARFGYTSLIQLERSHIRIRDMRKWRQTEQIHRKKKNNNNSSTQPKRKKRTGFMWTVLSTYISWNNVFCITTTQTKANVFIGLSTTVWLELEKEIAFLFLLSASFSVCC